MNQVSKKEAASLSKEEEATTLPKKEATLLKKEAATQKKLAYKMLKDAAELFEQDVGKHVAGLSSALADHGSIKSATG